MSKPGDAIAVSDDVRERELKHWQERDRERREHAIHAVLQLREELVLKTGKNLEPAEFQALLAAATRIYLMARLEDVTRRDHQSLSVALVDAVLEGVHEVIDAYGLRQLKGSVS